MTPLGAPTPPSRGLVLGCGGTLGAAWTVGALHSLQEALGWDPRDAEVLLGTSAGAELVSLLGGGIGVADLLSAQLADEDARPELVRHFATPPRALPPRPALFPGSPPLARRALRRDAPTLAGLSGLLPQGRGEAHWLAALADFLTPPGQWVRHPATWLVAADFDTGRRTVFGHPDARPVALRDALRASWAVPGWFPPVRIDGLRYADGGILSTASADVLAPLGLDEVYVIAPMSSATPVPRRGLGRAEALLRRAMTRTLDAECAALRAVGTRVVRIEPTAADLRVMGGNFMDPRRRPTVLETALRTTRAVVRDSLAASSAGRQAPGHRPNARTGA
ncbi:patatin-like phospholipase family protein [Streptomyces graminofaciens]|uniref:patatin-like phospholipase family protein n=1 Tax=Streptomyces graminofaciens TaxID=68212 RepID=UPI002573915E|nr:patatin-like phospholipase family protein [Streptomyces graminofaciens]